MRQIIIYSILGLLLVAAIVGWQVFSNSGGSGPSVQKYDNMNALPPDYRELVTRAAILAAGPDIALEFSGAPEKEPASNTGNNETGRPPRWLGKVFVSSVDKARREWVYIIESGRVVSLVPASENE